jgi:hypothetical protein
VAEILEPVFRTRNGFEDECGWQPVDGSVMCPLNQVTMKEVYLRTAMADASFKMVVEAFRMLYNRSPVIKSTDRNHTSAWSPYGFETLIERLNLVGPRLAANYCIWKSVVQGV